MLKETYLLYHIEKDQFLAYENDFDFVDLEWVESNTRIFYEESGARVIDINPLDKNFKITLCSVIGAMADQGIIIYGGTSLSTDICFVPVKLTEDFNKTSMNPMISELDIDFSESIPFNEFTSDIVAVVNGIEFGVSFVFKEDVLVDE